MNCKRYLAGAVLILWGSAAPALATLVDFDDLPAAYHLLPPWSNSYPDDALEPDGSYWAGRPLTDQYIDLGLSFGTGDLNEIAAAQYSESGAALISGEFGRDEVIVSGPNAVSSHYSYEGLRFWFVGDDAPDYLSFYASAPAGAMTVYITDSSGATHRIPLGWSLESGEFEYTKTPIKQKVEFASDLGIDSVWLSNFYNHRSTPVYMDDLYFGSVPVSAPAALPVMLIGLAGFLAGRRRRRA